MVTKGVFNTYGKPVVCCAFQAHGKAFAMGFSRKRTTKAARHILARQRTFAVRFYTTRTAVALPCTEFNVQQRISECIKNSSCAKTDARQRLQKTIKKHSPVGLPVAAATCYTTSATNTSCSEKKGRGRLQ
jgi:hypothetical protein